MIVELSHGLIDIPLAIEHNKAKIFVRAFDSDCFILPELMKEAK